MNIVWWKKKKKEMSNFSFKTNKNYRRSVLNKKKIFWLNNKPKASLKELVLCSIARASHKSCAEGGSKPHFYNASMTLKYLFFLILKKKNYLNPKKVCTQAHILIQAPKKTYRAFFHIWKKIWGPKNVIWIWTPFKLCP